MANLSGVDPAESENMDSEGQWSWNVEQVNLISLCLSFLHCKSRKIKSTQTESQEYSSGRELFTTWHEGGPERCPQYHKKINKTETKVPRIN